MKGLNKKEIYYSIAILTIPLVILFSTYFISKNDSKEEALVIATQEESFQRTNVFNNVEIIAKGAIVKDMNTGKILYAKNPDVSLPLASITKILTILTVDKLAEQKIITIDPKSLLVEGRSDLLNGESFDMKDLIDLTLTSSSNRGAMALSSSVIGAFSKQTSVDFIEEMNKLAQEIGMTRSRFYNETGLDENERLAGAYGSANDVAELFEYTVKNNEELMESTNKSSLRIRSEDGLIHNVYNTNKIVDDLPNVIAGKTGYTDIAGGNLAVIIDPFLNRPIIVVVLGSTQDDRFEDVKKLSDKTMEYFKNTGQ